jgi:hypothetical protein
MGQDLALSLTLDREPSEAIREEVSIAAAEIIADFPEATRIHEVFHVHSDPIPNENILTEGWIFLRAG